MNWNAVYHIIPHSIIYFIPYDVSSNTSTVKITKLELLAGDAAAEFERLPIVQDAALLQNILYSGVWTRFDAAFRTKQEEPT